MNGNGINAYKQVHVSTADPKRLVILCYEQIISNLRIAQESYRSKDYETKAQCIQKAQDIIFALENALDFDNGGEVARNLYALYDYFSRHILESDIRRDIEALGEDIKMLEELKSAWQEIFYGPQKPADIGPTMRYDGERNRAPASLRA